MPIHPNFYGPLTNAEKEERNRLLLELSTPIEVKRARLLLLSIDPLLEKLAAVVDELEGARDTGVDGTVLISLSVGTVRAIVANARGISQ